MATRSRRLTIGLLAGLVAVLVLGGAGAIMAARHERQTTGVAARHLSTSGSAPAGTSGPALTARPVPPTSAGTMSLTSSAPTAGSTPAPPTQTPGNSRTPPADSDPTTAPTGPSNNLTVQMSPAARSHPRAQDVQQLLQSYFDAINQHNYDSWTQAVTSTLASHQTSEQWLQAYATTVDSSIWMQSMRDDPMQVQMRFTSQQDPDLGPKDMRVDCIHWILTYQLATQDGQLAVASTVDGSVSYTKC